MARLSDIRPVLKSFGTWAFIARVWQQICEDGIFVWASALAYSWLFSIFPFLILLLSLIPYLPPGARASAHNAIKEFITSMLGKEARTINDNIGDVMNRQHTGWLGIGLAVSIWVASGGMSMTMSALDRCYDIKKTRSYVRHRAVAIAMTLGVTLGMLVMIVLLPIGTAVGAWLTSRGILTVPLQILFDAARYFLSLFFAVAVLAVIYYFGPNIRRALRC